MVPFALLLSTLCACAGTRTEHPCGELEPLGCSIPQTVLWIEEYAQQADKFHEACVTHDLCYRHGNITYGLSREECDEEFYVNMKAACAGPANLGMLDPEDFAKCQLAANRTYAGVVEHGEPHFKLGSGSYCEYRD
jgi:hypothetical protein